MERTYLSSSEVVANGHPDRLSDLIASIIVNDVQHKDGYNSHAALEVFLTHDTCTISGEVTTTLELTDDYLHSVVAKAYERAGYLPEMRQFWAKDEVCLASDLKIENRIFAQSPDIALGTTNKGKDTGWNDQGIFYSSSDNSNPTHLGFVKMVARDISDYLAQLSGLSIKEGLPSGIHYGPDIKVVVTCRVGSDGFTPSEITAITIAIPHDANASIEAVREEIQSGVTEFINASQDDWNCPLAADCAWVIDGTGRFVVHGNISDVSTCGRKLAVNMPSGGPCWANQMLGGGALANKPYHASDLLLPLACRYLANLLVEAGLTSYAVVGMASAIGQTKIQSIFIHGDDKFEDSNDVEAIQRSLLEVIDLSPKGIVEKFKLLEIDFSEAVEQNLFGEEWMPWEQAAVDVDKLKILISK